MSPDHNVRCVPFLHGARSVAQGAHRNLVILKKKGNRGHSKKKPGYPDIDSWLLMPSRPRMSYHLSGRLVILKKNGNHGHLKKESDYPEEIGRNMVTQTQQKEPGYPEENISNPCCVIIILLVLMCYTIMFH